MFMQTGVLPITFSNFKRLVKWVLYHELRKRQNVCRSSRLWLQESLMRGELQKNSNNIIRKFHLADRWYFMKLFCQSLLIMRNKIQQNWI